MYASARDGLLISGLVLSLVRGAGAQSSPTTTQAFADPSAQGRPPVAAASAASVPLDSDQVVCSTFSGAVGVAPAGVQAAPDSYAQVLIAPEGSTAAYCARIAPDGRVRWLLRFTAQGNVRTSGVQAISPPGQARPVLAVTVLANASFSLRRFLPGRGEWQADLPIAASGRDDLSAVLLDPEGSPLGYVPLAQGFPQGASATFSQTGTQLALLVTTSWRATPFHWQIGVGRRRPVTDDTSLWDLAADTLLRAAQPFAAKHGAAGPSDLASRPAGLASVQTTPAPLSAVESGGPGTPAGECALCTPNANSPLKLGACFGVAASCATYIAENYGECVNSWGPVCTQKVPQCMTLAQLQILSVFPLQLGTANITDCNTSCNQSLCTATGAPMNLACPLVSQVCSLDPWCCMIGGSWDWLCVAEAKDLFPNVCF